MHIHKDALDGHKNPLITDDPLATGGAVIAALDLIGKLKNKNFIRVGFVLNLTELGGLKKLEDLGFKSKYLVEL